MWTAPLSVRVPVTFTCSPTCPSTALGFSIGTTLPSVTRTGFSPRPTQPLAHCAWSALAPLAAHFASLIQPSHVVVDALAATLIAISNRAVIRAVLFIVYLLSA